MRTLSLFTRLVKNQLRKAMSCLFLREVCQLVAVPPRDSQEWLYHWEGCTILNSCKAGWMLLSLGPRRNEEKL